MKELIFEELTTEQKLGLTYSFVLHYPAQDKEFVFDLIKKRHVGSIWIQQGRQSDTEEIIAQIRALADYPILIMTDAESGIGNFTVGKHNAIGTTGSTKHAYAFGKTVGVVARKMGYNVVCDPVVDMDDGSMRCLGMDKEKVAELAIAIARGMHDGGVLTVAKHYPGGETVSKVDTHTAESTSALTKDELLENSIYPYLELNKAGLLDGIMTRHCRYFNIDDKYPASLSKTVIDIIRESGYEGFAITDALVMMGIRARFSDKCAKAHALNAGNDLILPFFDQNKLHFEQYKEAYREGLISDKALDTAVKRILAAQHKTTLLAKDSEISEEEALTFQRINKDGVYMRADEGVSKTIDRDGKHFFVITLKQETDIKDGKPSVDTFSGTWQRPNEIANKIAELFPNSKVKFIHEFPSQYEMETTLSESLGCKELIFMTFSEALAFIGPEHLTRRIVNLISAMQCTDRISTLIHLGNPHTIEELPHIKRVIFGSHAIENIKTTLEVLAGVYPANGNPTYNFKLQ